MVCTDCNSQNNKRVICNYFADGKLVIRDDEKLCLCCAKKRGYMTISEACKSRLHQTPGPE